jgi:hypothetical protein
MKQPARLTQDLFALRATEFVRRDGSDKSMAGRAWMMLQDQFSPGGKRYQLAPQPSQHPPEGAVVERSLVNFLSAGRCHVANDAVTRLGRFPIRLPVLLDVRGGQMEKCWTGVAFIGEYENRDNR